MTNSEQLHAFVTAAKSQGASDEFLVAMLRDKGWPAREVYAALARLYAQQTGIAPPEPPGRLEAAREAFFHLLAFVTLATWIFSIGSIWFDLIAAWIPDPAVDRLNDFALGSVSRELACIIVAFPVFIWATRSILQDQLENPDKAESAVRRWVSNVGLLLTAMVCLGDLITFLTVLLQGGLTTRFAMKCAVVLLLAGAVFLYYSRGLGKSRTLPPIAWHRVFAACAGAAMLLTLGLGFWSNGSPANVRLLSEDHRRVSDLHSITVQLQNKRLNGLGEPPVSLADAGIAQVDPFTIRPYEYRRLDAKRYQLCAEFGAASPKGTSPSSRFWAHPPGRSCFDITFGFDGVPYPPHSYR